jgi:hypothetical protein
VLGGGADRCIHLARGLAAVGALQVKQELCQIEI